MDLTTRYLGLDLRTPLVASSCPLTGRLRHLQRLEDAGISAVVLPSLFEEQLVHDSLQVHGVWEETGGVGAEATSYFPDSQDVQIGARDHLALVSAAKDALSIPVIASLNGVTPGGWASHARALAAAGADAIELNMYAMASDPTVPGGDLETRQLDLIGEVRDAVAVPLAVKLGPFYSSLAHFAVQVVEAGADGLVLFNRFYQPDLDLDAKAVVPRLVLSTPEEMRLPLRWVGLLFSQIDANLALTTGVHSGMDAAKALLAGADVTMMASALLLNGPEHVRQVEQELVELLTQHGYDSVTQLRGSYSRVSMPDPVGWERANYLHVLASWAPFQAVGAAQAYRSVSDHAVQ